MSRRSPDVPAVRLRAWRQADAREIASMANDDHVRHWSNLGDDVEAWVARERLERRGPSRAICVADDDRAVGKIALLLPGYASPAATWGLALAAVRKMLETVIAATELRSMVLDIEVSNAASLRLAQRLGAERREPARIELDRSGAPRTLVVHVLSLPSRAHTDH